jgi:crotonobetainyl-CoA:carnitine CoA-transferase CaiB-like acyl-CoA transferase
MSGPLTGIRVVDFGHFIAGPMTALLLADAGADVVRIERPDGPSLGLADMFFRRGKRTITLDLDDAAARDDARSLIANADVVIENFRPGVMDRLGVGSASMLGANSRLVYCSLPGFAAEDELADVNAWEGVIHAATAGFRPLNEHWDPTGRVRLAVEDRTVPLFTPITTASNFAAMLGATMIVAALTARERSGRGQRIELPLAEAMIEAYSTMINYRARGDSDVPAGVMLRDLSYRCANGGMIDLSPHPKFVFRLLDRAGVAEEWERLGWIDRSTTSFQPDRRAEIQEAFASLIASRSAEHWDAIAIELQLPLAMVRTPEQWLASDHATVSGAVVHVVDPDHGPVAMPGVAVDLPGVDIAARLDQGRTVEVAEVVGQWSTERAWTSESPSTSRTWTAGERPLDGLRVLDMTQAVAGPTASRLLADLGADVIKVGNTKPGPTDGIVGHLHRGKRTMLLDTAEAEGRAVLSRLVADADALVTNFTVSAAERYGLDHATIVAQNPSIVYCSITAYGTSGPWAERRAYENQCNATTGMSWWYGNPLGWTLYQPTPINDAATGILAAFGTIAALFARRHGGVGGVVATSLAQASTWHQATSMVRLESTLDGAVTRRAAGTSALMRMYAAADRSLFLAARPRDVGSIADVLDLVLDQATLGSWAETDGPLAQAFDSAFRTRPASAWEQQLGGAGVAARAVSTIDEATAFHAARNLVYFEPGPTGDLLARPGIGAWLSDTPPAIGPNRVPVGSDAVEILHELGLDDREIATLADAGIVCLPAHLPQVALRA